jgi:NADH:ubiquinone oxidoreductase subunit K
VVGMLQIITYLLCLYLIFKGFEIFQIAIASPKENNRGSIMLGVVMIIVSIIAAVGFAYWITDFAESIHNNMQTLPSIR